MKRIGSLVDVVVVVVAMTALGSVACKKGFGQDFEGEVTLHTTRAGGSATDMRVLAKGDKLRFEVPGPDGKPTTALFDPAANKVVLIMDAEKAYMDMNFGAKGAPAPNTDAKTSNVDKTGKHETIAGFDCEDWVAKEPSGNRSEVCIAEGLAFFDLDSVRSGGGGSLTKELRDKKYFPLRSVEYDAGGKELSRTEATKIEKKTLDATSFAVPAGYTKLPSPK